MIAIVDYQMGNLRSVQKAIEHLGHSAVVTDRVDQLAAADKIILPGVGAFAVAMQALRERRLDQPLIQWARDGTPLLGICLGMQLLMQVSYEDGEHQGLGLVAGSVLRFDLPHALKVPHMGWNQVAAQRASPLLSEVADRSWFYFVHSYYVVPEDPGVTLLEAEHGHGFCAALQLDNLFATQFHPEKSQAVGLRLLRNFCEL